MAAAKVFFTDFRSHNGESMPDKLLRLCREAGPGKMAFDGQFTAIKMHFGEPGNTAFLRPNYAKVIVDKVRSLGGKPFLTDCNTLYTGLRRNALDHLEAAYTNGFSPFSAGCHVLIADGLKGTDEAQVDVAGDYVRSARIGRAVMDADIVISLTHFKAHEATGIGGALKNIGMGCGSYEGKKEMHSAEKPAVDRDACIGCETCLGACAHGAIHMYGGHANISTARCTGCGRCISACPSDAIHPMDKRANEILAKKIAEYTLAVLQGRPHFHVALMMDISPYCDCYSATDAPIVPNIGMAASFDPVALDMACAEMVMAQAPNAHSVLGEAGAAAPGDHFKSMFPETDWQVGLAHAEKMGLGTRQYQLVRME